MAVQGCPLRQNYTLFVKSIRLKIKKKLQFLKIQIFLKILSKDSDWFTQKCSEIGLNICLTGSTYQCNHFYITTYPFRPPI
jgi:hypothetical protein